MRADQPEDAAMDRTLLAGLHAYVSTPWLLAISHRSILAWLAVCADYYAAAVQYEELRRLSNAELRRRGLDRQTLARDICAAWDQGDGMR
jgi:hypothetical protein